MSNYALSTNVQNVTGYIGRNTVLPCWTSVPSSVLELRRPNQRQYVALYRDGHLDRGNQIPRYENRVRVDDRGLVLTGTELNDAGTYECRFKADEARRRRRGVLQGDPDSIFHLNVESVQNITVMSGHDAFLVCRAPRTATVAVLEWTRDDLGPEEYVYLLRDGVPDPTNQHRAFQNRAELRDQEMKDGDVTLILKNVTSKDTGTYKCRLKEEETSKVSKRSLIDTEPISVIKLQVVDSGDEGGAAEDLSEDEEVKVPGDKGEQPGRGHYGVAAVGGLFGLAVAALGVWGWSL